MKPQGFDTKPSGFDPMVHVGCPSKYNVGGVAFSPLDSLLDGRAGSQSATSLRDSCPSDSGQLPTARSRRSEDFRASHRTLLVTTILSAFILISAFAVRASTSGGVVASSGIGAWIAQAFGFAPNEPLGFPGKKFGKYTEAELWSTVKFASQKYSVAPELIWAMIHVESRFDHKAKSRAGALGLMQLMPGTAKELSVQDPFDAHQNILGGTKYMSELLGRFNNRKDMALAAYNAGPGAVQRHGGIPPYRETKRYVTKVMGIYHDSLKNSG